MHYRFSQGLVHSISYIVCPYSKNFEKLNEQPHRCVQPTHNRMLVPQADGYSRESVHEFLTQVAQENLLQSWRETMLMVHEQPTKLPTQRPVTSVSIILYLYMYRAGGKRKYEGEAIGINGAQHMGKA